MDYSPPGSSVHRIFLGKNTGVGYYTPSPGDLPNPGTESGSPVSLALAGKLFYKVIILQLK